MKKNVLAITLSAAMLAGLSTCSVMADDTVTITFFDKNSGSKTFDDAVAQKIMEETGVKLEIENPTGDPSEKLNLMLSGQNYPDMILMGQGEIVSRYIDAGALVELDSYLEDGTLANAVEMYGDTMNKTKAEDGHNYWLANWYGEDPDASAGVLMRKDLLAEIVGEERANDAATPFTQSEYTDILKQFKEKFPELEGKESIALEINADAGNYVGTLRGMFGMKSYGVNEDGTLSYLPTTEAYKEALLYLNELYTANLLDKEWVVNKTEQWEQKLSGGYVFSTWNSYWDTDGVNSTLAATIGEDAQFFCYKVVADSLTPEQTTYNGRSTLGWDAIAITNNCENVDAALRIMNYLSSEEGQYLLLWGVEGETWDMEDGVHKPHDDFYEELTNNYDETSNNTGARKWTWFIKNGLGSDGTPYDLSTKYVLNPTAQFANDAFPDTDNWDTADFNGLEPAGSSPLGLKWQKVTDVYDQGYSKVINAASQDEAIAAYEAMVSDMDKAGLKDCEEYISETYQARMNLWYGEN